VVGFAIENISYAWEIIETEGIPHRLSDATSATLVLHNVTKSSMYRCVATSISGSVATSTYGVLFVTGKLYNSAHFVMRRLYSCIVHHPICTPVLYGNKIPIQGNVFMAYEIIYVKSCKPHTHGALVSFAKYACVTYAIPHCYSCKTTF